MWHRDWNIERCAKLGSVYRTLRYVGVLWWNVAQNWIYVEHYGMCRQRRLERNIYTEKSRRSHHLPMQFLLGLKPTWPTPPLSKNLPQNALWCYPPVITLITAPSTVGILSLHAKLQKTTCATNLLFPFRHTSSTHPLTHHYLQSYYLRYNMKEKKKKDMVFSKTLSHEEIKVCLYELFWHVYIIGKL